VLFGSLLSALAGVAILLSAAPRAGSAP
jgi:hypothetical protein